MYKNKLFSIVFEDNTTFEGGFDYSDTKWKNIPINKKIRSLFYRTPFGEYLCLSGYDKYYHMIEATVDLNGKNRGKSKIDCVRLFARKGEKVKVYKFNLLNNIDKIEVNIKDKEDNFIKKLNPIFWR